MRARKFAWLATVALLVACKGREQHDPLAAAAASAAPEKPKKSVEELFSRKAPSFPAVFHGVKPGMTGDEAQKLIPGIDKDYRFELVEYGTQGSLYVDSTSKRVQSLRISAGKDGLALAKAAWGEPKIVKDTGDRDINYWFNPAEHVRAKLETLMSTATVAFDTYMPMAEFLGSDKAGFAFEQGHPIIGSTPDDVKKNFAAYIEQKSAAENAARLQRAQAFAGTNVDLGPSAATLELSYPPSEFEIIDKTVNLYFEKGKAHYYTFSMSYREYPAAKDEVLALLKKAYGEPKSAKDLGDPVLVFRKSPTIKVKDNTISKAWYIKVEK
jgi:hypothetical protein